MNDHQVRLHCHIDVYDSMHGSVTLLINRAKNGDDAAAGDLLAIYIPRLLEIARNLRITRHSTTEGGSDFVMTACAKLWQGLIQGRLQTLDSRDNLWPLLLRMTLQEAKNHARSEFTQKRGCGESVQASALTVSVLESVRSPKPAYRGKLRRRQGSSHSMKPDESLIAELESVSAFSELIEALPGDLREVAVLRLLGYRNEEIATFRETAERSVERKLKLIRDFLQDW